MAIKDVELFIEEKRKNEALKKEWDETAKEELNLKENQREELFNKKLHPIVKKYGFDFSFDDFCEYKKHSSKPQDNDEKLSDDNLFNVAGGRGEHHGPHEHHRPHRPHRPHGPHEPWW